MYTPATQANPFALLMDPDSVFRALQTSNRLEGLERRVCRPLDKPLIPHAAGSGSEELDDVDDVLSVESSDSRVW